MNTMGSPMQVDMGARVILLFKNNKLGTREGPLLGP